MKSIRLKPCNDLDGVSDEMAEDSGKENMKTLGTRIYSSRTNSEGRDYSLWGK